MNRLFKLLDDKQFTKVKVIPNERESKTKKASEDLARTASAYSIHGFIFFYFSSHLLNHVLYNKKPEEFSNDDKRIEENFIDININLNKLNFENLKSFCEKLRTSLQ